MGSEKTRHVKAGDSWQMAAGMPHSLQTGDRPMKTVSTFVYEKDKPIASPAPE